MRHATPAAAQGASPSPIRQGALFGPVLRAYTSIERRAAWLARCAS